MSTTALVAGSLASTTAHTPAPFSNYQPILDRMPFGAPPPAGQGAVDPAQAQTDAQIQVEQQKLAKQINMSCVNVTPDGTTAIGFTDLGEKPPVNYYLLVGATAGGWKVVDADYDLEVAVIEKDGITINLKLGKGLIDDAALKALIAAAAGPATTPAQEAAANPTGRTDKKGTGPTFKTGTEQLLAMELSLPPGVEAPPLPILPDDGMAKDVEKALATTINIEPDDDEKTAAHKEGVAWAKVELKDHIEKEGGTAKSYLERLHARRDEEVARQQQEREVAREKLRELAAKITADEFKKQRREINKQLIEAGIEPVYGE